MSKKYESAAVDILTYLGGAENVNTLRHCQTRLRFVLKDQSKVNQKSLEVLPAVLKVIPTEGMYQIVALSGADMFKALMALLVVFNVIDNKTQTYYIINFFADAVFYFLPVLLAFSQAQKLKCNPVLAAAVAGIMMHPTWSAMVPLERL